MTDAPLSGEEQMARTVEGMAIRISILVGRMRGCRDENADRTHGLIGEAEAFEREAAEAAPIIATHLRSLAALTAQRDAAQKIMRERHYCGSPLTGGGFSQEIVMVRREWYERLRALLSSASPSSEGETK